MTLAIAITTKATAAGIKASFPLSAAITGMTAANNLNFTVKWENDKNIAFDANDLPVIPDPDDNTQGTNSGTQMVAADTARTVKFTAHLMEDGNNVPVVSSTPVPIEFKQLSATLKFFTDKLVASTVTAGSLTPGPDNLIKAVVIINDPAQNPVAGVEVQWKVSPKDTTTLSVYQDTSGALAPNDDGLPYSLSASNGEATAYFADLKTHQYVLSPRVLGSEASSQTTVIFAGTEGEYQNNNYSFNIQAITTDEFGQEIIYIINGQNSVSTQPEIDDQSTNDDYLFFALMNDNLIINTTVGEVPPSIPVSYGTLKSPLSEAKRNPPPQDFNKAVFYVQDFSGNVSMSPPTSFYSIGSWGENIPSKSKKLNRILRQARVMPEGTTTINTDTIRKGELLVKIPQLDAIYKDKYATVMFYLNGYYKNDGHSQNSGQERYGTPDMPGLTLYNVKIEEPWTTVKLDYQLIYGYGFGPNQEKGYSYVEYYVDINGDGSQLDYSIYPIKHITNTVFP